MGGDKSVISLLQKGPIPKGFILTLNEPAYYRVEGIGLHELGYTGLDITPEMFESNLTLEMVAKPELSDRVPQNYSQEGIE